MNILRIDGIPQDDLDRCVARLEEIQRWAMQERLDRWAFRAALLKALHDDSEEYFRKTNGTFREIAAFDNGVATAIESIENS
jgi:hypothetical protein